MLGKWYRKLKKVKVLILTHLLYRNLVIGIKNLENNKASCQKSIETAFTRNDQKKMNYSMKS